MREHVFLRLRGRSHTRNRLEDSQRPSTVQVVFPDALFYCRVPDISRGSVFFMAAQILVVDDNEVVRGRLSETLNSHDGWEVCAAVENGEQALMKARELHPDLIILDVAMPVMDGLRATREILRILPSVPIVIYTLHNMNGSARKLHALCACDLWLKSDIAKLIDVLEDLLHEKSPVQSAPVVLASTEAHAAESRAAVPEQLVTEFSRHSIQTFR